MNKYYHVSVKFLGPKRILWPLEIKTAYEPVEHAICVAPTIKQCLYALPQRDKKNRVNQYVDLYVYVTDQHIRTKAAKFVYDYDRTGERRIYEDCRFRFVRVLRRVPIRPSSDACDACWDDDSADAGTCELCFYDTLNKIDEYCKEHNIQEV